MKVDFRKYKIYTLENAGCALKLKVDLEKSEAGKNILTGSSQFKLKKTMTDSLAGRAFFFGVASVFH